MAVTNGAAHDVPLKSPYCSKPYICGNTFWNTWSHKCFVHTSVRTTLDIYSHTTDTMQQNAGTKIDKGIAKNETSEDTDGSTQEPVQFAKFEAKKNKYRKPGTGCVYKINDHLYEGKYSPTNAHGKRISKNVYAKTEEE